MATANSLKKKQQQLQADQDLLADRWTEVLAAEEYKLERPSKKQPKRRRQRRRSKPRQSKSGDTGTGGNNTLDSAEDNNNPLQQELEQEDGKASPPERAADGEAEDDNYMPPPKTRQTSAMTNSPCQRIPSNKSASSADLWPRQIALRKSSSTFKLIKIC